MYFYDNDYTLTEIAKTGYSLLMTKLFFKDARLIRRPCYIRGMQRIQYGKGLTTGFNCRIETFGSRYDTEKKLVIGANCKMGDNVHLVASKKVTIGDNCLMASKIFISDTSHGEYTSTSEGPAVPPDSRSLHAESISIGDNVWIGENVCILKGVNIGNGAIISAGAVVTRDIPDNCIAAGIPAKVIKCYDKEKGWYKV